MGCRQICSRARFTASRGTTRIMTGSSAQSPCLCSPSHILKIRGRRSGTTPRVGGLQSRIEIRYQITIQSTSTLAQRLVNFQNSVGTMELPRRPAVSVRCIYQNSDSAVALEFSQPPQLHPADRFRYICWISLQIRTSGIRPLGHELRYSALCLRQLRTNRLQGVHKQYSRDTLV